MTTAAYDFIGLDDLAGTLGKSRYTVEQIAQQTINRAAQRGRTRAARAVRDEVKQSYAYALDKIAASKVSIQGGVFQAEISAEKKGLLLSRYSYKDAGRDGVDVEVGRGNGRKRIKYAFVINATNGTSVILFRKPGQQRYNTLYGPSASQIFDTFRPEIAGELGVYIGAEMDRRIALAYSKRYGSAASAEA